MSLYNFGGQPSQPPMGGPSYGGGPPMNNFSQPPMNSFSQPPPMNQMGSAGSLYGGPPMNQPPMNSFSQPPMGFSGPPMGGSPYGGGPPMNQPPMNSFSQPPMGMSGPPMGGSPYGSGSPMGPPMDSFSQPPMGMNGPMGGSPMGPPVSVGGNYGSSQEYRAASGYNKLDGNKRAVLIGINYIRCTSGQLRGCINDVQRNREFLLTFGRFPASNIYCLTDDQDPNSKFYPTRANMIAAMNWLVGGAGPSDSLFFHYSGHGGQSEDKTHLEDDGMNETILPADYQTAGMIDDDTLHKIMVKNLPAGCKFTAIFDSCHSGTALDLPYIYKADSGQYKNAHKAEGGGFINRFKKNKGGITKSITSEVSYQAKKKARGAISRALNTTKADVIMFSGCRDEQTSADASIGGQATGAMSYAFIGTLQRCQGTISYADLLHGMRDFLHNGPKKYTQMPQLSYGRPMDMNQPFLL